MPFIGLKSECALSRQPRLLFSAIGAVSPIPISLFPNKITTRNQMKLFMHAILSFNSRKERRIG